MRSDVRNEVIVYRSQVEAARLEKLRMFLSNCSGHGDFATHKKAAQQRHMRGNALSIKIFLYALTFPK